MILRRSLQCHYCGQKSGRKYDGKLRSWSCTNCEAINYLDAEGNITDPPAASTPKSQKQYGRAIRRTTSPNLSPQGNNIFCKQCLTNQHFVQQNLAEYLPAPSDPLYPKFVQTLDRYKRELEERYPQVCADCAPRVNERLKATTYAANADNFRRGLSQKKPSPFAADWRKWGWRRIIVAIGGTLWWTSLVGQAAWHVLGVLPPAEKQLDLLTATWRDKALCAIHGMAWREMNFSCLESTREAAWLALWAGVAGFWWNNQLGHKLYSRERRLRGLESYLLLQVLVLALRAAALLACEHSQWIPAGVPENGIHGVMIVFLAFTTLISLTTIKLTAARKPNSTNYHPVQVDPSVTSPQSRHQNIGFQANTEIRFPVSSLAKTAPRTPSHSQPSFVEHDDNEMDWTPTGPSQITHISPQVVPEYRRPEGLNPFQGKLPPAPMAPAHRLRNPPAKQPFVPASESRKKNFLQEMRGEIRGTTDPLTDDEDDMFGGFGKKKSKGDFQLRAGNMRDFNAENKESGLENLFNTAFSMADKPGPSSKREQEREPREQGYIIDGDQVRENVIIMRAVVALGALVVVFLALAIGMGWIDVKGFVEGFLYQREIVSEVHSVVEDVAGDDLI